MPVCQSSSVSSSTGARGPWPALLTSTSMRPHCCHRQVDQALQVVVRLVRSGDADAAEFLGQRLALAGRGQDRDLEPVRRQPARRGGAHAAATGGDEGNLGLGHARPLWFADRGGCTDVARRRLARQIDAAYRRVSGATPRRATSGRGPPAP